MQKFHVGVGGPGISWSNRGRIGELITETESSNGRLAVVVKLLPEPQWFPGWPTVRQPGRACALLLTGCGWTLSWGAADVLGTWMTLTPSLLTNCSSLLTINCLRKLYTTQLTFFSCWFRTAHRHLMTSDLAPMTNFFLIKLHILVIVNLSFACPTETAIDYCTRP